MRSRSSCDELQPKTASPPLLQYNTLPLTVVATTASGDSFNNSRSKFFFMCRSQAKRTPPPHVRQSACATTEGFLLLLPWHRYITCPASLYFPAFPVEY